MLEEILTEDDLEELKFDDCDPEKIVIVEDGDWVSEGKYDIRQVTFKILAPAYEGKFYQILFSRTGSYYTDYYYDEVGFNDIFEVEQKEVTKIVWVPVKK